MGIWAAAELGDEDSVSAVTSDAAVDDSVVPWPVSDDLVVGSYSVVASGYAAVDGFVDYCIGDCCCVMVAFMFYSAV